MISGVSRCSALMSINWKNGRRRETRLEQREGRERNIKLNWCNSAIVQNTQYITKLLNVLCKTVNRKKPQNLILIIKLINASF